MGIIFEIGLAGRDLASLCDVFSRRGQRDHNFILNTEFYGILRFFLIIFLLKTVIGFQEGV